MMKHAKFDLRKSTSNKASIFLTYYQNIKKAKKLVTSDPGPHSGHSVVCGNPVKKILRSKQQQNSKRFVTFLKLSSLYDDCNPHLFI